MEPLAGAISAGFLGHLEEIRHLTGTALAGTLFNLIYFGMYFLRQSTTGVTAQAVGRGDRSEELLVALRNGCIALGIGVILLLLQYPLQHVWFALVSGTPEVKAAGMDYFSARIWGAPAVLLNFVVMGWLFGKEQSGRVLWMTAIGNAANIGLDYLFIVRLGWESFGAGVSQALSPYLMLLLGLIFVFWQIRWQELRTAVQQLFDWSAFQAAFAFNSNVFIGTFIFMCTYTLFNIETATMETTVFAEDTLLGQILVLAFFFYEGLGLATESLVGNFKGSGENQKLLPLLQSSSAIALFVGLGFAFVCVLFPQTVFGLFTNHSEVTAQINIYVWWLIPVLVFSAVGFLFEGYLLGLAEGQTLRDATFIAAGVGFVPVAVIAWQFHSNHYLWLALSAFLAARMVALGTQLPRTLRDDSVGEPLIEG